MSITASTRRAGFGALHGHGKVTSSITGRWGSMSARSRPANSESSASEPMQVTWPDAQRQIGSGVPQNRSRESAQSTLFASHSPKRPSRMYPGCQSIVWFCRDEVVLAGRGGHVPAGLAPVDERSPAAPAVGVGVHVGHAPDEQPRRLQRVVDVVVGLPHLAPGQPARRVGEPAVGADRVEGGEARRPDRPGGRSRRRRGPGARARCPPRWSRSRPARPATRRHRVRRRRGRAGGR